ncbi:MAG: toxin-antitoxin system HicB family antitoxin [Actinomycetota bacterium]
MGQITVRADDELVDRVKAAAADVGRSMNEWIVQVLDTATDPDLEGDETTRLREKLRQAGLLYEPPLRGERRPIDPDRLAAARQAMSGGVPLSKLVIEGRE